LNGIINIYKPKGITSFGVIRKIKTLTAEKKMGHLGTLDPLAQGVLPIFIGKMTKLIPLFNQGDKDYDVTIRLGARSTTLDSEGEVESVSIPDTCTLEVVNQVIQKFIGEIEQIPPMFSAIKIQGKKLYQYARKGLEVERKPRLITIHSISNIRINMPDIRFLVHCSKGTYIRTLADDIGRELGTAGYLLNLVRTRCEKYFTLDNIVELGQVEKLNQVEIQNLFIDPVSILPNWHALTIKSDQTLKFLCQGRSVQFDLNEISNLKQAQENANAFVKDQQNRLLAIGSLEFSQDFRCIFKPSKVLI
jgi:tRNA pseudouridine55 synthase